MRGKPAKATANELRDIQALDLRKAGATFDQIARQLGYAHKSGAHHAVKRALDAAHAVRDEMAAELIELELARLDAFQLGAYQKATHGDPRSIEVSLKVMERRAALLGMDAPKRQEISGPEGGAIQIDQDVTYSVEERQQRILSILDAARGRFSPALGPGGSDLDTTAGSTDKGLAQPG